MLRFESMNAPCSIFLADVGVVLELATVSGVYRLVVKVVGVPFPSFGVVGFVRLVIRGAGVGREWWRQRRLGWWLGCGEVGAVLTDKGGPFWWLFDFLEVGSGEGRALTNDGEVVQKSLVDEDNVEVVGIGTGIHCNKVDRGFRGRCVGGSGGEIQNVFEEKWSVVL